MQKTRAFNLLIPFIIAFGLWATITGRILWETFVLVLLAGTRLDIKLS